jgi:hypothetical protein
MATYNIKAMYEYEGDIEADSPEEAEKLFLADLNDHYAGTYSFDIEKVEEEEDDEDEEEEEGE